MNRHELTGGGGGPIRVETETIETLLLDAGRAVLVADAAVGDTALRVEAAREQFRAES